MTHTYCAHTHWHNLIIGSRTRSHKPSWQEQKSTWVSWWEPSPCSPSKWASTKVGMEILKCWKWLRRGSEKLQMSWCVCLCSVLWTGCMFAVRNILHRTNEVYWQFIVHSSGHLPPVWTVCVCVCTVGYVYNRWWYLPLSVHHASLVFVFPAADTWHMFLVCVLTHLPQMWAATSITADMCYC